MPTPRIVVVYGRGLVREAGVDVELVERVGNAECREYVEAVKSLAKALSSDLVQSLVYAVRKGVVGSVVAAWIDGLASEALGGSAVIELYGSVLRLRCSRCSARLSALRTRGPRCPRCGHTMVLDVVPRGGGIDRRVLKEALYELTTADVVVVLGLEHYDAPVYVLLALARRYGARLVCTTSADPPLQRLCHYCIDASPRELLRSLADQKLGTPFPER